MDFDVLITGGDVVDGSGAPRQRLDVGIAGGRVVALDRLEGARAARVIDARGLAVAPGFIDVHVHSELARLSGVDQFAGVLDGVTTELMSPDGFSWAPLAPERLREVKDYLQVFYGDPDIGWDWTSVAGYLSLFEGRIPNNLVPQAPHLAIKVAAMGWAHGAPSPEQMAAMTAHLVEWLDAGAVGMAAGLEYQPGALSHISELIELCRVVAAGGGVYAPHQRGYWSRLAQGCGETFEIGRRSGVKVHISHLAVDDTAAGLLDEAQASGVDVSFDMYPYSAACTHLLMMLPEWAQAGGYQASMGRLTSRTERERLRPETAERIGERGEITLSCVEAGETLEGRSVGDLARESGQADVDCLFDLLAAHAGRALAIYHWPESIDGEGILQRTIAHPLYIGSTDGIYMGTRPHRRGFGSFARIVGEHVRAGTLTLEQAVHKVTGLPAERFSLSDRGLLQAGRAADVAVFDPATLADRSTWDNGRVPPSGIAHVLVNGEAVVTDGLPTRSLPGRIVGRS
ncbi:MAG TPA: amidohydrolase family protein [Candidatus Dormibacteraeota bacterium]|nr:amidohydrolase family protein [Candidatus Dormibacteraeota bacterium]